MAETEIIRSGSGLWHLRVAEGDHLSERSEGRKLPQHKTRALATLRKLKAPLRGWFGGDARGAAKGAQPLADPPLPRAAQASKTSPDGETSCPKGRKKQNLVSILYGAKIIFQKCGINLHIHQCDRSVVFDVQIFCDYRLKRKSFEAAAGSGIYASRREIT